MAGITDPQQIPTLFGKGSDWKFLDGSLQPVIDEFNRPVADQYTAILVDPEGHNRPVTIKQRKGLGPNEDPNAVFYDPVKGPADVPQATTPQEQNENIARATADRATAEARAKEADIALKKANEDAREAAYNQSQGNGYLTHEQLRKQQQDAAAQGLNADQIAVQKSAMENNNLNTIVSNQIAAQNASTAAANAASQSRATEAQIKHIELGDADTAAKFEYLKAQDEIKNANDQRDQTLKELTQQQQNAVQVQQNAIRGQELAQRTASDAATLEQRKVEAGQTAETQLQTAGTNAAANVFGTERQAQTAAGTIGGNLLSSRATAANSLLNNILTGAGGMSQGSAGRYGMLGGGLQASSNIAGLGQALASGVQNTITQQFGGQNTLDAAARMVRGAAPGAEMSPMGQVAIGVLHQVFDRMGQGGVPAAAAAAQAAATTTAKTGGLAAPVTTAPLDVTRPGTTTTQFSNLSSGGAGPVMGTPGVGGPNAYVAPVTVPPPLAVNNLGNLDPRLRGGDLLMGVTIGGVRHEELADPGEGSYASVSDYNAAAGPASQQGGENLNWGQGGGGGGGGSGSAAAVGGTGDYGAALQQMMDAMKAGNAQAFTEAVRQFDLSFGLDKDKLAETLREFNESLALSAAAQTGTYQGAPTLPALTSYATQFGQWGVPQTGAQTLAAQQQNATLYGFNPTLGTGGVPLGANGQPLTTLAAQNQAYTQQLGAINAAAALQANPFRQQQVIGQLGQVLGGGGVAGFSAPNTVAGVGTAGGNTRGGMGYLQTLIDDIRDPGSNTAGMNQVLDAIPTPAKLNSVEFLRSAPSTQSMVLQGMQEKYGLNPDDALQQIKSTLPQFQAPTTMGSIKR